MTKRGWMAAAVLISTGALAAAIGLLYSKGSADLIGIDEQPLRFSHELHAGRLHVECLYCHRSAEQSTAAGIPSMQLCMGCHRNLAMETKDTATLVEHWKRKEPVSWVRLQRLPDFVYFTHERHLAHGLECVTCHGHVDQMPYTPRAATYEMGWCLSCHQERGASRDCWTCHK
jgi:hypothetical protein